MNPFFIFLFLCTTIAIIYWFKNATAKQGITALKITLIIAALLIIILIVTGRLPIFSGIPLIILGIFRKFALSKLLIPFIKLLAGTYTANEVARDSVTMDDQIALKTLGLNENPSREEIVQAHRKLMRIAEGRNKLDRLEVAKLDLAREHLINKNNV